MSDSSAALIRLYQNTFWLLLPVLREKAGMRVFFGVGISREFRT
jgi:hypothetical protein